MNETIADVIEGQAEADGITLAVNNDFNKTKICPVCGEKYYDNEGLLVTFPGIAGIYCLRCYGEWIAKNLPKLVDIKKDDHNT